MTDTAPPINPPDWRQQGVGANWQHQFFHWLIRVGGRTRAYHIAYIVTFWYVVFYPGIRKRCRFYLDRRFPERCGFVQRFRDTFRLVRTYAVMLVDMAILRILGPAKLKAQSPNHQQLKQLAASDKGLILLHAHIGCWQAGMSNLDNFQKKVSVVMIPEPRTVAMFDPAHVSVIDPRAGLTGVMQMTQALLAGEIVAVMGDRTFGDEQNVVHVNFLGGRVTFPITPYRLASATGLPILVLAAPKTGWDTFALQLRTVIEVPPGLGRNAKEYEPYAQQYADALEAFVSEFPFQFYNFFDLWNAK